MSRYANEIFVKNGDTFISVGQSRPDWSSETKKALLTSVINSQWAYATRLSEFLTTFNKDSNENINIIDGVIDSLDRKNITSWLDLKNTPRVVTQNTK